MIVSEIHKAFKVLMDKNAEAVSMGGCPAFLPEEIDLFLNQAYNEVIMNKFTGNNTLRTPFEGSIKRMSDLQRLIKTDKIDWSITEDNTDIKVGHNVRCIRNFSNKNIEGNNGRMLLIKCRVDTGNGTDTEECRIVDHEEFQKYVISRYNYPWIKHPVVMLEDDTLYIAYDPDHDELEGEDYWNPISFVYITYITYPTVINYKNSQKDITEVDDNVWYEVINRAVVLALENIESQRSQTKVQLNNLSE